MTLPGEKALKYLNQKSYFLNGQGISCYFDTKYTTVVQIEQILQKFKYPKIAKILNPEEVYFLVTCVTSVFPLLPLHSQKQSAHWAVDLTAQVVPCWLGPPGGSNWSIWSHGSSLNLISPLNWISTDSWLRWWYTVEWAISSESVRKNHLSQQQVRQLSLWLTTSGRGNTTLPIYSRCTNSAKQV